MMAAMRQRGRKSSANLVVLPAVDGNPPRIKPPAYLNKSELILFDELVSACSPCSLVESDVPLLVSYVQATLIARDAAHDPKKFGAFERAVKMQATLATRLRLTPHSRITPRTAGRQQEPQYPRPWEIRNATRTTPRRSE